MKHVPRYLLIGMLGSALLFLAYVGARTLLEDAVLASYKLDRCAARDIAKYVPSIADTPAGIALSNPPKAR